MLKEAYNATLNTIRPHTARCPGRGGEYRASTRAARGAGTAAAGGRLHHAAARHARRPANRSDYARGAGPHRWAGAAHAGDSAGGGLGAEWPLYAVWPAHAAHGRSL